MQTEFCVSVRYVRLFMAALVLLWSGLAWAQPLDDAAESDFAELSHSLRCMVCQNQSIAESNAPLAVDLREQVREQLAAGRTRQQIVDYMVARYGDFVLYKPPFRTSTLVLWIGPGVLFFMAVAWLMLTIRRRNARSFPELNAEERARAQALLARNSAHPKEPQL